MLTNGLGVPGTGSRNLASGIGGRSKNVSFPQPTCDMESHTGAFVKNGSLCKALVIVGRGSLSSS